MKHFLLILSLLFVTSVPLFAQDDPDDEGNEKIKDKMNEYIQKRLDLSKDESAKFTPVFLRYFKEWKQTLRTYRGDKLELQKQIVDLRLRYRTQFREILGERRGNQVFDHQEQFIREIRDIRRERLRNNPNLRPQRRATQFLR
jgi:hypothetical protein